MTNNTRFFPTPILNHSITPSYAVRNLGVTFDSDFNFRKYVSLTCRSSCYHIRELRRIGRYISLSVDKTIDTALITSRIYYCKSLLYNIATKVIATLQCFLNCLASVVTRSLLFAHSVPLLKSLHWPPVQSRIILKFSTNFTRQLSVKK